MPLALLLLTGLIGAAEPPLQPRHPGRTFVSPMGEPFFSRGPDDRPLADWFAQADVNHDGILTGSEMEADADRFFARLDADHDGEIGPDEITAYEQVIAPLDRAHLGLLPLTEPVTAADRDFSRGVTRDEFRRAAQQRFQALDVDHQGRLTVAGLQSLRPPPPARQRRDLNAPPDLDPNADTGG